MSHDIIGDIHGHADRLEALLTKLGYRHQSSAWSHSDRTAIFVGDLVDRGPGQLRTLELVRAMTDSGSALAIMGNHEFNAIAWGTLDPMDDGTYLRARHGAKGQKNRHQHQAFLSEVGEDSAEHRRWIEWFMTLPLWIEEPGFRVVHACWSPRDVATLTPHLMAGARMTPGLVEAASRKGTATYDAVETLLKGAEVELPAGHTFTDKDGHLRSTIRVRWWDPSLTNYRSAYIGPPGVEMPDVPIPAAEAIPEPDRPTFIGHYWLDWNEALEPLTPLVGCVDYSVAKGGPLVAYRFDGETELTAANFVAV
jgi:hypothetical protein